MIRRPTVRYSVREFVRCIAVEHRFVRCSGHAAGGGAQVAMLDRAGYSFVASAASDAANFPFGSETIWLVVVKVVAVFVLLMLMVLLMIWWERRLIGFMQYRIGPNRIGPFGLMQSLMDAIK